MSNNKNHPKEPWWKAIIAPIVITLVAGGTAPWWWEIVFPPLPPPSTPPSTPTPAPPTSPPESVETRVSIPNDVEAMWVFYQDENIQSPEGCERAHSGDLTPDEFKAKIGTFIEQAKSTNRDLIITAKAPSRDDPWESATQEIQINGTNLSLPTVPYWCNGSRQYGFKYQGS